jgi:Domain of unknown function (DUF4345)
MATNSVNTAGQIASPGVGSLALWLSRIVLIPPTLIMILISTRFIGNPTHAIAPTGVTLSTPQAVTDMRVIGGLTLTLAFVVGSSLVSARSLRSGHVTVIALMALVLGLRLFGFAHDGTTIAMGDQKVKTIGEIVFLTLNVLGFALQTFVRKQTVTQL